MPITCRKILKKKTVFKKLFKKFTASIRSVIIVITIHCAIIFYQYALCFNTHIVSLVTPLNANSMIEFNVVKSLCSILVYRVEKSEADTCLAFLQE